jgi:FdrA protein
MKPVKRSKLSNWECGPGENRKIRKLEGSVPGKKLLQSKIEVVNIGLPLFAEALAGQDIPVVQVDWTPPAGGDERLIELLDRLSE